MKHPFDRYEISDYEKERLDEFISLSLNQSTSSPDLQQWAFCFLAARKFSVAHALELYQNYQAMLQREAIPDCIDPFDEDVRQELLSGKFVVLNDNDSSGARVAQFFVRLHRTMGNHRAVLQSILFQLDAALKRETAARSGLVFIYDMTDAKFSRVDCSFGMKLFKLLQSSYPVRLRRVLILTAPLWFRASFRMMRGLIREQLRDCVNVVKPAPGTKLDALSHPDMASLRRDHYAWLHTALLRSGWLLSESEQANRPNGHRLQTAAAFFGPPLASPCSISSGSVSDLSDPDSSRGGDDDEESSVCSGTQHPMEEGDESIQFGDVDPFGLSSSYSSEVDNGELDSSVRSSDGYLTSQTKGGNNAKRSEAPTSLGSSSSSSDHLSNPACLTEHSETPTPPSIAKRFVLPNPRDPTSTKSPCPVIITRSSTTNSPDGGDDMGFSENPTSSPLLPESKTPTADSAGSSLVNQNATKINTEHRNSAGTESCSSSISFFSTGSAAAISSSVTQSADCSPTTEQQPRIVIHRPGLPSQRIILDKSMLNGRNSPKPSQTAPLAVDEIGDQKIRNEKCHLADTDNLDPLPTSPPSANNLPSWAVGRPHGPTIHQGTTADHTDAGNHLSAVAGLITTNYLPFVDDTSVSEIVNDRMQSNGEEVMSIPDVENLEDASKTCEAGDENDDEELDNFEEDMCMSEESNESDPVICLDNYWMTPKELIDYVISTGLFGIQEEYNNVSRIRIEDSRNAFKHIQNRDKNRYCDVICYETSRVCLRPLSLQFSRSPEKVSSSPRIVARFSNTNLHRTLSAPVTFKDAVRNYIHANWVDGYRQKNAFICTQGPLAETTCDFWQMIWDYHIPIIVMITKVYESDRVKCFPYWPDTLESKLYFASGRPGTFRPMSTDNPSSNSDDDESTAEFEVSNIDCQPHEHFTCCRLRLKHLKTKQTRSVMHYAYSSWPDHGVPQTTQGLQQLLSSVQADYASSIRKLGYQTYVEQEVPPPPVVVHCSAGIGRTGTYVTADICTKWLIDPDITDHRINIPLTVSRIRSQRCGCVQVAAQYVFCYRVVLDFAVEAGLLSEEAAESVQSVFSPKQILTSPVQSFLATSFYPDSSSSLPRNRPFAMFTSHDRVSFDVRQFLQTSQLSSLWQAITANKGQRSTTDDLADENFVMMENPCLQSDLDSSSCSSRRECDMLDQVDDDDDDDVDDDDDDDVLSPTADGDATRESHETS